MKSFVIAVALFYLLSFVWAEPTLQIKIKEKEQKAIQECNVTIPVQRSPQMVLVSSILTGDKFHLTKDEKCFMHCILEKVGFLNDNATIRNGSAVVKRVLEQIPDYAKYTDLLIAHLFQLSRATKDFDDKCLKAYITYHQFGTFTYTLAIADGLERFSGVKDKVVHSIQTGTPLDPQVSDKVKEFLELFHLSISTYVKESMESSTPSPQQPIKP